MAETKLACLRVDISRDTGEIMLLIKTGCGFRQVMGWLDVNDLYEFDDNLLGICSDIKRRDSGENNGRPANIELLCDADAG
ncbi:MAG: hypothetical protein JW967_03355 [Dehalococcoidales bacterium]|nr:hypothetical protein [Dehalococcoidales bacterium]